MCHDAESSELIMDLDLCPSCSRPLQSSSMEAIAQERPHKRRKVAVANAEVDTPRNLTIPASPHEEIDVDGTQIHRYPTKLNAVVSNLSDDDPASKRFFHAHSFQALTSTDRHQYRLLILDEDIRYPCRTSHQKSSPVPSDRRQCQL